MSYAPKAVIIATTLCITAMNLASERAVASPAKTLNPAHAVMVQAL